MNRCSFCEWIPILPWPVWPLAGHARLGQNTVVGSMTILLSWLCWGACQEEVCLDPRFLCNLTLPRFSVELPSRCKTRKNPLPSAAYATRRLHMIQGRGTDGIAPSRTLRPFRTHCICDQGFTPD